MINNDIKVLVANRGEIAIRIFKTLKSMGIRSVAMYASFEKSHYHTDFANECFEIPGTIMAETYLNIDNIIGLAITNGCTAIHPGYGFVSENADFAEKCAANNIIFIGPDAGILRLMGDKINALGHARELKIPVLKSFKISEIKDFGSQYLIKAAHGGGGRGMRIVKDKSELNQLVQLAKQEAGRFFGNEEIYLEKYIENPRHIEVQVLGDKHGNIVHLFERECSVQRRFQKIIEEAPAVSVSEKTKQKLYEYAVLLAKSLNYNSAGTFEFLIDENENIYFLEVNTRIQVEHPVTEMVTGIDIVKEQINAALGFPLSFSQNAIKIKGHAIEARVCSEDAENDFTPSTGNVIYYHEPEQPGIRVDSGITSGSLIEPWFDSMLSKIIAFSGSRERSIQKLSSYLKKYQVHGIKTNVPFLINILNHKGFISNKISTSFIKNRYTDLIKFRQLDLPVIASAVFLHKLSDNKKPAFAGYWRNFYIQRFNIGKTEYKYFITYNYFSGTITIKTVDNTWIVDVLKNEPDSIIILFGNVEYEMCVSENHKGKYIINNNGVNHEIILPDELNYEFTDIQSIKIMNNGKVTSPLHGKISKINIDVNKKVKQGDILLVIESMKIENNITAHKEGIVKSINVTTGEQVYPEKILMHIE